MNKEQVALATFCPGVGFVVCSFLLFDSQLVGDLGAAPLAGGGLGAVTTRDDLLFSLGFLQNFSSNLKVFA
jgi:hypothetical protein